MAKEKVTVDLVTKEIVRTRSAEEGLTMGAYLDALVERDDLRRRIKADRAILRESGLDQPPRVDALAAAALQTHRTRPVQ